MFLVIDSTDESGKLTLNPFVVVVADIHAFCVLYGKTGNNLFGSLFPPGPQYSASRVWLPSILLVIDSTDESCKLTINPFVVVVPTWAPVLCIQSLAD